MDVDSLLRQLVQGDVDARIDAAELLPHCGDRRAVGALVQALRDPDSEVRAAACDGLGTLGDPRGIPPLVTLLRDDDDGVRGEAFSALLRVGQARASKLPDYRGEDPRAPSLALTQIVWPADLEAVKLLYEALADPDPALRIVGAYALGRMGVAGAYDGVSRLLDADPDPEVRAAAAFAMGDLMGAGEGRAALALAQAWSRAEDPELAVIIVRALAESSRPEAWPVLSEALEHPEPRVRQLAVMGLAETRAPGAARQILPRLRDPHGGVRRNSAFALGRLAEPESLDALISVVPHSDAEVRSAVGWALRHFDRGAVRLALNRAAAAAEAPTRQAAAYLRGQLHESDGLREALADADPEVRKAAALALGSCQDPRSRPALEAALTDPAWRVRVASAEGLRRLGDPEAVAALRPHARDPHPVVQNAVRTALAALGAT